jgi:uncharacterized protein YndB with AHSA1/START domain
MTTDRFQASFRLRIDRDTAWHRQTADEAGSDVPAHLWLPGFDSQVTVVDAAAPDRLRATKDDEPCAGTDIVVTLEDEDTGTRVHVTQSRSGDWLPTRYEIMSVGWRYIVADLRTYLATGVQRAGTSGHGATSAPRRPPSTVASASTGSVRAPSPTGSASPPVTSS